MCLFCVLHVCRVIGFFTCSIVLDSLKVCPCNDPAWIPSFLCLNNVPMLILTSFDNLFICDKQFGSSEWWFLTQKLQGCEFLFSFRFNNHKLTHSCCICFLWVWHLFVFFSFVFNLCFVSYYFILRQVSQCILECSGTYSIDQAGLNFTGICLPPAPYLLALALYALPPTPYSYPLTPTYHPLSPGTFPCLPSDGINGLHHHVLLFYLF